jgi:hypothetical protein
MMKTGMTMIPKNGAKYMLVTYCMTYWANKIEHFRKGDLEGVNPDKHHWFRCSYLYACKDGKIIRIKANGTPWSK